MRGPKGEVGESLTGLSGRHLNLYFFLKGFPGSPGLDGRDGVPGEPGLDGKNFSSYFIQTLKFNILSGVPGRSGKILNSLK